jgi:hypothetical protein
LSLWQSLLMATNITLTSLPSWQPLRGDEILQVFCRHCTPSSINTHRAMTSPYMELCRRGPGDELAYSPGVAHRRPYIHQMEQVRRCTRFPGEFLKYVSIGKPRFCINVLRRSTMLPSFNRCSKDSTVLSWSAGFDIIGLRYNYSS